MDMGTGKSLALLGDIPGRGSGWIETGWRWMSTTTPGIAIFLAEGRVGLKRAARSTGYRGAARYSWPRVGLD